ncbi:MAG: hypothetical protein L3J37_00830 [Rhodobacteraceae bacterium]|nr:hypothetical protein [Paracoccaceae bacterium]
MIDTVIARGKVRQLMVVMEAEREVLLRGPLEDLEKISAKRDALLEALVGGGPVTRQVLALRLADIREMATRNGGLIKAAMEGMKAAMKEVANMEEELNKLATYAKNGERMVVAHTPPGKGHKV